MSRESLITKYRPKKFSEVVGQNEAVRSFRTALGDRASNAFLFTGPAGCGKTSMARLGADFVGANSRSDIMEIDAATQTGVDDMRSVTAVISYRPLGKVKAIIVDECHVLSSNAWKSLYKSVEEPPEWLYWFFCTTDLAKVPDPIITRCSVYKLKALPISEIFDFIEGIVEKEGFDTPKGILDLCAKMSEGSPRNALSNLSVCYAAKDRAEAAKLIADSEAEIQGTPFSLAKALAEDMPWTKIRPLLESLATDGENPETVRHVVQAYFTKVVLGSKDEKMANKALRTLYYFSEPFNSADGFSPVVVAVGRCMFSGG